MLTDMEIAKPIVQAVSYVLSTFAKLTPISGEPYLRKEGKTQGDVSATVSFTGDKTGFISVIFTKSCAEALVRGILGEDVNDFVKDMRDTVGEVTNMISGHARKELVDIGLTLRGSTPTVVFGDNHSVERVVGQAFVFPFETVYGAFWVEVAFDHME